MGLKKLGCCAMLPEVCQGFSKVTLRSLVFKCIFKPQHELTQFYIFVSTIDSPSTEACVSKIVK